MDAVDTGSSNNTKKGKKAKAGLFDFLSGDNKFGAQELSPYLPFELVGGSVPYVAGTENEAVWNAASQACGTERVHYTYTIEDGRCWYLSTPSSALSSFPNSWCPLAAALPGNSEFWDTETVYLYEQEGQASALRWDPDTHRMQLFLGPSRTILPKLQSMDANFVTINPEMADTVTWTNHSLRSDQLSRAAGRILLLSGLVACVLVALTILTLNIRTNLLEPNLEQAQVKTQAATSLLMQRAQQQFRNEATVHMIRIQELLDALLTMKGTLVRYEVSSDGRVEWDALVPRAFSSGDNPILGKVTTVGGLEDDDRVRIRGTR
jgi:hypothetical protein